MKNEFIGREKEKSIGQKDAESFGEKMAVFKESVKQKSDKYLFKKRQFVF